MKKNLNDGMEVMISDYIENNLSKLDKENFEKYMKNNIEFSSLVNSIKINKSVMSNEPYVIPLEIYYHLIYVQMVYENDIVII